jgi:multicomponent Na+:H+ antiporter subunit A
LTLLAGLAFLAGFGPFVGARPTELAHAHEGTPGLWIGALLLAVCGLLAGVVPGSVAWIVGPAAASITGAPVQIDLGLWHGFTPMLGLSALALAGGTGLYWSSRRYRQALIRVRVPEALSAAGLYDLTFAALNRLAVGQTHLLQSGHLRYYLATIVSSTVALTTWMLWRRPWPVLTASAIEINWLEAAVAFLILVAAASAVLARNRLGAVAMLGVVGYGVAVLFAVNGAPDLAMTQFIIEALTVVLFVFVVYRLPRITVESTLPTRLRDGAIALSAGALMATFVWVAMQMQLHPSISTFFTERSVSEAHGRNVVNVILVDFRALDTLGEIAVLALAGVGVHALVRLRPGDPVPGTTRKADP